MRALFLLGALSLVSACSSNDTTDGTPTSSSSGSGGAGGKTPACGDDASTPEMECGALSITPSDIKSRKRNHHATFLAKTDAGSFIYVLGGTNGGLPITNVDRYPVHADGSLDVATDQVPIPVALGGMTGGVVSQTIVFAGGTKGNTVSDKAYASVVGADGTLGAWAEVGSVGHPRMHPGSVVRDDTIYVLGGFDDPDVWDDIVKATVTTDGSVSQWEPAGSLPGPLSHFSVTRVGDDVYLAGGLAKSAFGNPPMLKATWHGHFDADGNLGDWVAGPALPVGLATHASFFYGGYLYVGGGIATTKQEKRIWRAPIGADHELGEWEETASFGVPRGHVHQLPVFENHVYSFGGAIDFDLNSTDEIDIGTFE